jgi:hypothetical protein
VFLRRERFVGLGNDLAATSPASIDARVDWQFPGPILLVELRTAADFHVIAAPEQRHDPFSFADHFGPDYAEWLGPAYAGLASLRQYLDVNRRG